MDIALQSNLIVIRTSRESLELDWINDYIKSYKEELLFLSHSVIIYHTEEQLDAKKAFLSKACEHFAQAESLDPSFFQKAIMCCLHYPIKIQMSQCMECLNDVAVTLTAHNTTQVKMELNHPDPWFLIYMQSKLQQAFTVVSDKEVHFSIDTIELKERFERSLNRDHIFSRRITYHYAKDFLQTLFSENNPSRNYYNLLGCDVGAPLEEIKRSYKRLAKKFHPDQINHLNDPQKIHHYTKKFQAIQEAYNMLRGA